MKYLFILGLTFSISVFAGPGNTTDLISGGTFTGKYAEKHCNEHRRVLENQSHNYIKINAKCFRVIVANANHYDAVKVEDTFAYGISAEVKLLFKDKLNDGNGNGEMAEGHAITSDVVLYEDANVLAKCDEDSDYLNSLDTGKALRIKSECITDIDTGGKVLRVDFIK